MKKEKTIHDRARLRADWLVAGNGVVTFFYVTIVGSIFVILFGFKWYVIPVLIAFGVQSLIAVVNYFIKEHAWKDYYDEQLNYAKRNTTV